MQPEHFDLNDIDHEPTDQQLDALMASVAAEARRRADRTQGTVDALACRD